MQSARARNIASKVVMYIVLIIMSFIMLVPFAWMILTALKTNQEAISVDPFYIFPVALGELCGGMGELQLPHSV